MLYNLITEVNMKYVRHVSDVHKYPGSDNEISKKVYLAVIRDIHREEMSDAEFRRSICRIVETEKNKEYKNACNV